MRLVEAKAQRTLDVMKWLAAMYGELPPQVQHDMTNELERLDQSKTLPRLLSIEGRITDIHWRYVQTVLPAKFGFNSRMHECHEMMHPTLSTLFSTTDMPFWNPNAESARL